MEISPKANELVPKNSGVLIIACNTPDELSVKISDALKDGKMFLHGQPFVFKDQICQAVKSLSYG